MFNTLIECKSFVSILNITDNLLDDECVSLIGDYIQSSHYLEELSFGGPNITDLGIDTLADYLVGNTTMKHLHVHGNDRMTDASLYSLIDIAKCSHINNISIGNMTMCYKLFEDLEEALNVPIEQRGIPIRSKTKSASKVSSMSSA